MFSKIRSLLFLAELAADVEFQLDGCDGYYDYTATGRQLPYVVFTALRGPDNDAGLFKTIFTTALRRVVFEGLVECPGMMGYKSATIAYKEDAAEYLPFLKAIRQSKGDEDGIITVPEGFKRFIPSYYEGMKMVLPGRHALNHTYQAFMALTYLLPSRPVEPSTH